MVRCILKIYGLEKNSKDVKEKSLILNDGYKVIFKLNFYLQYVNQVDWKIW